MILEYRTSAGGPAYGCPVEVFALGQRMRVVYQFPGGGQPCAVVHPESGQIMAYVLDSHAGYPQEKAQTALNAGLLAGFLLGAPVLNPHTRQVGVMKRCR